MPLGRQGLDWKYMMWQSRIILFLQENCRKSGKWEILDSLIQISNIQISENKEQGYKVYITYKVIKFIYNEKLDGSNWKHVRVSLAFLSSAVGIVRKGHMY